jgi:ribonuclease R
LRNRGLGEMLIEDFMILTNEFVASTFQAMNLPFMYRIHEAPAEEKLERFIHTARNVGHKVKNKKSVVHTNDVRTILEEEKDELMKTVLSSLLLRSLPKAVYAPDNIGHFGLASDAYMQVTSPIRRYPDLVSHRLIKQYMFESDKFNQLNFDAILEYLEETGIQTSYQEKRAEQLERDVTKMKMAEYMEDQLGKVFTGKISGFTEKGMFVQLPNMVEGYVKFETLKDDMYFHDRDRMCAFGKRTNKVFRLGDEFKIKVIKASKAESMIDFAPAGK